MQQTRWNDNGGRSLRRLVVAGLVAALGLSMLVPATAIAAPKGSITGTVRADGVELGQGDYGVELWQWNAADAAWYWMADDTLDDQGQYSFRGLGKGRYTLFASAWDDLHSDQWFGGAAVLDGADSIQLGAGERHVGADFDVVELSHFVARVVDADDDPVAMHVVLNRRTGSGAHDYEQETNGYTDDEGVFEWNVSPGTYTVCVSDWDLVYASECFEDATDVGSATPIVVAPEVDRSVTLEVARGGSIEGTAADVDGVPLDELELMLYRFDDENGWFIEQSGQSDASGGYRFGGLAAGDYAVRFNTEEYEPRDPRYASVFTGGAIWAENAASMSVQLGEQVDAGVERLPDGIELRVRGRTPDGKPVAGSPSVQLFGRVDGHWRQWGSSWINGDGANQRILGVPEGEWRIGVLPPYSGPAQWWRESYSDAAAKTVTLEGSGVQQFEMTLGGGAKVVGSMKVGEKVRAELTVEKGAVGKIRGYTWYRGTTEIGWSKQLRLERWMKGDRIRVAVEWNQKDYGRVVSTSPTSKAIAK